MSDSSLPEDSTVEAPRGERPGGRIGQYKIRQKLGEGGFGSVFEAEQEQPVRRLVALKVIKLGMDTEQVIARFEAERQALAMMDHPHIARVLDAGATETGRPYFVMELVKGEPITTYCDRKSLSIVQRLDLFGQVCAAVQHAHSKGIIHRDIKPSNVLVATHDDRPFAKVIDFGIAKATSSKLTEKTLFTEHNQMIGTPAYMSPEQAEGTADLDTRTDIYSLGVLLYELLTGTTPFEPSALRLAAVAEIQRIIREVDPPRPSARLSSATTLADAASHRSSESRKLVRAMRGDLDWIVMKAIEKDRARRYETASGLATDVRRYLAGEPVLAAPPSSAYRVKKFVRRHKAAAAAGLMIAASLIGGIVVSTWQAVRARRSEAIAVQEAAKADAVKKFLQDMLGSADAFNRTGAGDAKGRDITVAQALAKAVEKLDRGAFKDQPLVEAEVRYTIGETLAGLGDYKNARVQHDRSLALRQANLPPDHEAIAASALSLGVVYQLQARWPEAEKYMRQSLAIRKRVAGTESKGVAEAEADLSMVMSLEAPERLSLIQDAVRLSRRLRGDDLDTAQYLAYLGSALIAADKPKEAESAYRDALAIERKRLGGDDPRVGLRLISLARTLTTEQRYAEAEAFAREGLNVLRKVFGVNHARYQNSSFVLVDALAGEGHFAEAEALARNLVPSAKRIFGEDVHLAFAHNALARLLKSQGKFGEAEQAIREAIAIYAKVPSQAKNYTASTEMLGTILEAEGKRADASIAFAEALESSRKAYGELSSWTFSIREDLAWNLGKDGKVPEAERALRELLRDCRAHGTSDDVRTAAMTLAELLATNGKAAEAEPLAREALAIAERNVPRANWSKGNAKTVVALTLSAQNRAAEAELMMLGGYDEMKNDPSTPPDTRLIALRRVVDLYASWEKSSPGLRTAQLAQWRSQLGAATAAIR